MKSNTMVLVATLAVQSLVAMSLLTLPVVAPLVADSLDVSATLLGTYIGIAYLAAMTASLLSGGVVRRYGAIRTSQIGLLLCAIGLGLSAIPYVACTALGALFVGLGYGPITPASSHLLIRSTAPERLSFVFSLKQTGVPLGGVLAAAIVPGLAELSNWQSAVVAVALSSLVCAIWIQPLGQSLDADKDSQQKLSFGNGFLEPLRLVFALPGLKALAGVSLLFSITQLSVMTYIVTCLHQDMGVDLVSAGLLAALAQVAGVWGRIQWGYMSDRGLGPIRSLAMIACIIAACSLLLPLSTAWPLWLLALLLFTYGFCSIGWNGVYLAEVARQAPAGRASMATGGTLSITFLGNVLGPPAFGAIAGYLGSYTQAYAFLTVPAILSLLIMWRYSSAFNKPLV